MSYPRDMVAMKDFIGDDMVVNRMEQTVDPSQGKMSRSQEPILRWKVPDDTWTLDYSSLFLFAARDNDHTLTSPHRNQSK